MYSLHAIDCLVERFGFSRIRSTVNFYLVNCMCPLLATTFLGEAQNDEYKLKIHFLDQVAGFGGKGAIESCFSKEKFMTS